MKIMHVLKHAARGNGHVHVAVDLACAQADAGHRVTFASTRGSYNALLESHGVEVVDVPEATNARSAARAALALIRIARSFRPHIIHAHMMSSAVLAFPVAKVTGAALVTTMHNSFDRHSGLMRLGRVVVAVSEAERHRLLRRGYPTHKVRTVLNGSVSSPRESLDDEHEITEVSVPCVMTLSGLHHRKAVGDAVRAFATALPFAPEWHLNIVGSGPDRPALEAMVDKLRLHGSVHFLGPSLTPWRLLEQAQIFVSSSLDEPFGLSLAEARAAGCAIVATAVGGVPEVLDHGQAGQLVPVADVARMAEVLKSLMTDSGALALWQDRAAKGAERFSVERMAQDYQGVYESVARRERPNAR
ncbi:glycosyltransferase family 4 protein [Geodermatophilus sp. SYSU D00698]